MYQACCYIYAFVSLPARHFCGVALLYFGILTRLLNLTLPETIGAGCSFSTSSVRRGVHLLLKEKDSGCMFDGEGGQP